MKAILKLKTDSSTTLLQMEFNTIKEAVSMAKHQHKHPFSSPLTVDAIRYDIYVNRVDNGANKFFKTVIKNS